jgi:hypothetical protein
VAVSQLPNLWLQFRQPFAMIAPPTQGLSGRDPCASVMVHNESREQTLGSVQWMQSMTRRSLPLRFPA